MKVVLYKNGGEEEVDGRFVTSNFFDTSNPDDMETAKAEGYLPWADLLELGDHPVDAPVKRGRKPKE